MKDLEGKVAFVTGAASGIGLGISDALAKAGVEVMLCDIDANALDAAVERLRSKGMKVENVVADVSLREQVQSAADITLKHFGKIHVLVNNAGVQGSGPYGAWCQSGWDWTFAVNMMSVIYGVEAFVPHIESHGEGGHVLSTASGAGLITTNSAPYGASKAWLITLSEVLRQDLAPRGIGVSVLCPGMVRTNFPESVRSLPKRFDNDIQPLRGPGDGTDPNEAEIARAMIENGLDPYYVGELAREGITRNWAYIMTDTMIEDMVKERFEAIMASFDHIRSREPGR